MSTVRQFPTIYMISFTKFPIPAITTPHGDDEFGACSRQAVTGLCDDPMSQPAAEPYWNTNVARHPGILRSVPDGCGDALEGRAIGGWPEAGCRRPGRSGWT